MLYDLAKAGHIVTVVLWFGGMIAAGLALSCGDGTNAARFRSWDRLVTTPAMIGTWAFGLTLTVWGGWFWSGWILVKLVFVVAISALHGILSGQVRRTVTGNAVAGQFAMRIALPAIIVGLCIIVTLVVTKAF